MKREILVTAPRHASISVHCTIRSFISSDNVVTCTMARPTNPALTLVRNVMATPMRSTSRATAMRESTRKSQHCTQKSRYTGFCDVSSRARILRMKSCFHPKARIVVSPWIVSMKDDTSGPLVSILGHDTCQPWSS